MGKASPLTIVHVTVSFGGIQLNGLQEELFGLTLTTLEKQRKWMIQQRIMMNYFFTSGHKRNTLKSMDKQC